MCVTSLHRAILFSLPSRKRIANTTVSLISHRAFSVGLPKINLWTSRPTMKLPHRCIPTACTVTTKSRSGATRAFYLSVHWYTNCCRQSRRCSGPLPSPKLSVIIVKHLENGSARGVEGGIDRPHRLLVHRVESSVESRIQRRSNFWRKASTELTLAKLHDQVLKVLPGDTSCLLRLIVQLLPGSILCPCDSRHRRVTDSCQ